MFNSTPGAVAQTSYISLGEADVFAAMTPGALSPWSALSQEEREQRLMFATMVIDTSCEFAGRRATATQGLKWPRYCVEVDGVAINSDSIPTNLKRAVFEVARQANINTLTADTNTGVVQSTKVGPLEITFKENREQASRILTPFIQSLIAPLLRVGGGGPQVEMIR